MSDAKQLPVNYEEQLRQELAQLNNRIEAPGSNTISTKGKLFKLPTGQTSPGPVRAVILDFIGVNVLYKGAYNPNVKQPPICFSIDKNVQGMVPSAKSPTRQHADCKSCPKNQFKSAVVGNGKACKNQRRLLLATPELDGEPMTIYVSPNAIKVWDGYVRTLMSDYGKLPIQVVTDITFNPNETYPMLQFSFVEMHGRLEDSMRMRAKFADMLVREPDVQMPAAA